MPFEVSWFVPNRIVMARFFGKTTPEENDAVSPAIIRLFEESPAAQVHVFLDDGDMEGMPGNLGQMRKTAAFLGHPKAGWIIGVAPIGTAVKFMGVVLSNIFKMKYKRFESVADACNFLIELEPDLKALMPEKQR